MKYGYLLVYSYSKGGGFFDLFGGANNNINISNAMLNSSKRVKDWTWQDFENVKKEIAESLTKSINYYDKDIKLKYEPNDIVIINMIEKKVEEITEE